MKILKKIFPNILSTTNIFISYIQEFNHFRKYNTNNTFKTYEKDRAILVRNTHGIEKSFSLPQMRPTFGIESAHVLYENCRKYLDHYGVDQYLQDAINVLRDYLLYHADAADYLDGLDTKFEILCQSVPAYFGAVKKCHQPFDHDLSVVHSEHLFGSRHSCRSYTPARVSLETVEKILELSKNVPSACNRQPWRVRLFQGREDIDFLLRHQNGNRGFGESIHNAFLVTGCVDAFSSKERNQVFIDCGLYCMQLMLVLHSLGYSSCPLNMSNQFRDEVSIKKELRVPANERLIMLVAFGQAADDASYGNAFKSISDKFQVWNSGQ